MRVFQQAQRGIAVVGPGYFAGLSSSDEVAAAVKAWGSPVIFDTPAQFDAAVGIATRAGNLGDVAAFCYRPFIKDGQFVDAGTPGAVAVNAANSFDVSRILDMLGQVRDAGGPGGQMDGAAVTDAVHSWLDANRAALVADLGKAIASDLQLTSRTQS